MSACEQCWVEACRRASRGGGHVAELYRQLLNENESAHTEHSEGDA